MFHYKIPLISQSKCASGMFFWCNLLNVYTEIPLIFLFYYSNEESMFCKVAVASPLNVKDDFSLMCCVSAAAVECLTIVTEAAAQNFLAAGAS